MKKANKVVSDSYPRNCLDNTAVDQMQGCLFQIKIFILTATYIQFQFFRCWSIKLITNSSNIIILSINSQNAVKHQQCLILIRKTSLPDQCSSRWPSRGGVPTGPLQLVLMAQLSSLAKFGQLSGDKVCGHFIKITPGHSWSKCVKVGVHKLAI